MESSFEIELLQIKYVILFFFGKNQTYQGYLENEYTYEGQDLTFVILSSSDSESL